ncbi:hypothetical protein AGMMS49949_00240 [Alphaproteobacteria bacterium]|nr:hypothetical protein AGMMS49949_00240 [Alphaproteobacteria bacterium]GHS97339.1 hypothetical protein AGMMS50296_4240 [Alphaproteobacteria bacterium]
MFLSLILVNLCGGAEEGWSSRPVTPGIQGSHYEGPGSNVNAVLISNSDASEPLKPTSLQTHRPKMRERIPRQGRQEAYHLDVSSVIQQPQETRKKIAELTGRILRDIDLRDYVDALRDSDPFLADLRERIRSLPNNTKTYTEKDLRNVFYIKDVYCKIYDGIRRRKAQLKELIDDLKRQGSEKVVKELLVNFLQHLENIQDHWERDSFTDRKTVHQRASEMIQQVCAIEKTSSLLGMITQSPCPRVIDIDSFETYVSRTRFLFTDALTEITELGFEPGKAGIDFEEF